MVTHSKVIYLKITWQHSYRYSSSVRDSTSFVRKYMYYNKIEQITNLYITNKKWTQGNNAFHQKKSTEEKLNPMKVLIHGASGSFDT